MNIAQIIKYAYDTISFMQKRDIYNYSNKYGKFSWQYLEWDTRILKRRVAKIISLESKVGHEVKFIKKLIEDFNKNKIEYATYRVEACYFPLIHALEKSNFFLVDGYLCLECNNISSLPKIPDSIRVAVDTDRIALEKIASSAFSLTRFYTDPQIEKEQADNIYREWIKNSLKKIAADLVLVHDEGRRIQGFITIKKNGNIVLIAVDNKSRGKGIGKSLVYSALDQFKKWNLSSSTIETQMINVPALRIYQTCGYKIVNSYLTFRWSS